MNKGDVFMAEAGTGTNRSYRPVVFVDKENVSCEIKGEIHYIVPENINISDVTLCEYITTIE